MTKNELIEMYREINAKVKQDTGMEIGGVLTSTVMTVVPLLKARRHAKKGNFAAATYYLLMWHSFKVSADRGVEAHRAKEAEKKSNPPFATSGFVGKQKSPYYPFDIGGSN